MKCQIFSNSSFLGEFSFSDLIEKKHSLSTGSIVKIENEFYCVGNVLIRSDETIVLEVS